jgi:predicted nucleic acid-binding protein
VHSYSYPKVNDFEDGLEYYSAIESKCDCIITEDTDDFYFSKIEVIGSEHFFEKYLLSRPRKK